MNKKSVLSELQFFWCGFGDGGHVLGMTRAHPVVEASVLVGDTDDDDGDGTATSPPHVFPTSLAHYTLPSHSLALPGHVTLMLYFSIPFLFRRLGLCFSLGLTLICVCTYEIVRQQRDRQCVQFYSARERAREKSVGTVMQ